MANDTSNYPDYVFIAYGEDFSAQTYDVAVSLEAGSLVGAPVKYVRHDLGTRPAAPVDGLEVVSYEVFYAPTREWTKTTIPNYYRDNDNLVRELVTRSQAEAIIAAERAEKEAWKNASIELDKAQEAIEVELSAERVRAAEKERLRFEGDLDKWMKIIGAGITGYQPEAYALMDLACEELVKLRADNAALSARVNELEAENERLRLNAATHQRQFSAANVRAKNMTQKCHRLGREAEALEAKLAAARKALEPFAEIAGEPWADANGWTDAACQKDRIVDWFGPSAFLEARAALEGKPS